MRREIASALLSFIRGAALACGFFATVTGTVAVVSSLLPTF